MEETASSSPASQRPDVRVYLEEKVFPILTSGLEELLMAVEENKKKAKEEEDVPEIQPLFFLARYLMKHSPTATQRNAKKEEAAAAAAAEAKKEAQVGEEGENKNGEEEETKN